MSESKSELKSQLKNIRAVLFDLDGTLLDTAPDLGAAVNHVLQREGMAPLGDEVIRRIASDGALGLLKAGFGEEQLAQMDTPALRQALLDYYADHLYEGTRPYPGMPEFIDGSMPKASAGESSPTNRPF